MCWCDTHAWQQYDGGISGSCCYGSCWSFRSNVQYSAWNWLCLETHRTSHWMTWIETSSCNVIALSLSLYCLLKTFRAKGEYSSHCRSWIYSIAADRRCYGERSLRPFPCFSSLVLVSLLGAPMFAELFAPRACSLLWRLRPLWPSGFSTYAVLSGPLPSA